MTIPQYVDDMTDDATDRLVTLQNFAGTPLTSFAFITDIHNCIKYTDRALYSICNISQKFPISFVCLGGDYLCNNSSTSRETAISQHRELKNVLDSYGQKPATMVIKGNHDENIFGDTANQITADEIYDILMTHHRNTFVCNENAPKSMYGYFDMESAKIRAIFVDVLDAVPSPRYDGVISNEQLNWIAHNALNVPSDEWAVMFFSHFEPVPLPCSEDRVFGGEALWEIIRAFKNGTKYSAKAQKENWFYDVTCDYSRSSKHDVIGWFCGHHHNDYTKKIAGIPVISVLAAASDNFSTTLCSDGTYHSKTRGSGEESAFSIFTVNRKDRIVKCIRCGAGPDFGFEY